MGKKNSVCILTQDLLDQFIEEFKKEETQQKVKVITESIVSYILLQLKPYILFLFITFLVIIVMISYIIVNNIYILKNTKIPIKNSI